MSPHDVVTEWNPLGYAVPAGWQILDALSNCDAWPPVDDASRERITGRFGELPADLHEHWLESMMEATKLLASILYEEADVTEGEDD